MDIVVTRRGLGEGLGDNVYDTVLIDRERLTGLASGRLEEILKDVHGFQLLRLMRRYRPTQLSDLLKGARVILLSEAGSGKTEEFGFPTLLFAKSEILKRAVKLGKLVEIV